MQESTVRKNKDREMISAHHDFLSRHPVPDEHSVPPTGRRRAPVDRGECCCGIRPSRRLKLEQGLDGSTQASIGVCKKKVLARLIRAKAHSHGAIDREQKKKKEWKRGKRGMSQALLPYPRRRRRPIHRRLQKRATSSTCGGGGGGVTVYESCMLKM